MPPSLVKSDTKLTLAKILAAGRANVVLTVGLVILIVNAYVAFEAARILLLYEEESKVSLEELVTLEQVLSIMRDMETGARGFVITGHASYLEPYESARNRVSSEVTQLASLTSTDPSQETMMRELQPDIAAMIAYTDELIAVRQEGGFDAARDMVETGRGRALMDSIRITVRKMYELEDGTFKALSSQADAYGKRTLLTLGIFTALSLLLLSSVHFLARRDLEKREEMARLLRAANEELETRVRERTIALEESNDRLRAEVEDRQRAEEALKALNTELLRSNRELEDFAYVASHDLQEPLRKIQTFASILELEYGKQLSGEGQLYLNRLSDSASRMSRLIADLLSFSRVTTKSRPFERTDLNEVIKSVLSDLEVSISSSDALVHVGHLPEIEADEFQIRQLFQNLIGNAIKFRHPDRRPDIRVEGTISGDDDTGATCIVTVSDNGIGFDEKYLDRIFTPFQRLHNKNEYEGTGIGLSICRRIVERHGGTITAHSSPGAGSTFIVTLPVHQSHLVSEAVQSASSA